MGLAGAINKAMTALFAVAIGVLQPLGPLAGMAIISLVVGVIMLWIFARVSNQDAIRVLKDHIRGNLIAVRIYQDNIALLLRLQVKIVGLTFRYMGHSLLPMIVMMGPVLLILFQLNLWFAKSPLEVGQSALLKVSLRAEAGPDDLKGLIFEAPEGIISEIPPVRISARNEVVWRIRADAPGEYRLAFTHGDETVEKTLDVGGDWRSVSSLKTGRGIWEALLYPGESPLRGGIIEAIEINYPDATIPVFGFGINWLVMFFVLSIAFGFALKGPLGVEI